MNSIQSPCSMTASCPPASIAGSISTARATSSSSTAPATARAFLSRRSSSASNTCSRSKNWPKERTHASRISKTETLNTGAKTRHEIEPHSVHFGVGRNPRRQSRRIPSSKIACFVSDLGCTNYRTASCPTNSGM